MAKDVVEAVEREAKHGQRMIEVKLRFWTNDIAEGKGNVSPKHAWAFGVARIESNEAHGIKASDPVPFNSLLEIGTAVEKVLIAHDIKLLPSNRMKKWLSASKK